MVAHRFMVAVVALLVLLGGCGGGSDDQTIADLEARIAELEAELHAADSTQVAPSPAVTTEAVTAASTTTTRAPATTQAVETTQTPTTTPTGPEDLLLIDNGFSDTSGASFDTVSYAVIFENPNTGFLATRVSVNVSWFDQSGNLAGTTSETISYVLPSTSAALGDTAFDVAGAESMEIQFTVDRWEEVSPGTTGEFVATGVQVSEDRFGTSVIFTVESSFADQISDPKAVAVFRDEDGTIVGGARTFVDFVPGGGSIPAEITALHNLGADSADVFIQPSSLSF